MVTCLETSLRPRNATQDDTFPGDDPNDDQASGLPHHEPKPPPKMAATDNSVLSSGYRTSNTTVGSAHSEYGPKNPRRSKRLHSTGEDILLLNVWWEGVKLSKG